MNRATRCIPLLIISLALASPGAAFAEQLATPDGRIVVGNITGLVVGPVAPSLNVPFYLVRETPADPVGPNASFQAAPMTAGPVFWGYEASDQPSRILAFTAGPPVARVGDCVPPFSINGRGVAYDPMDGNLWYTTITYPGFTGDGLIHKTTPPQSGACNPVGQIAFGDGPGGTLQDDIGAIDVDGESKHIWAAGYRMVTVGAEHRSYLYLVNRNNGSIIRSCWVPFQFGGIGNDSLTYARLDGLPGSGKYLLTDAGETDTAQGPESLGRLMVIDANDCRGGNQVTPVADYEKVVGMTGIDLEFPGLMDTDAHNLFNLGGPPFSTATDYGPLGDDIPFGIEDVSLCASRAKLGGLETCPY